MTISRRLSTARSMSLLLTACLAAACSPGGPDVPSPGQAPAAAKPSVALDGAPADALPDALSNARLTDWLRAADGDGRTALHRIAQHDRLDLVEALAEELKKSGHVGWTTPQIADSFGQTALFDATSAAMVDAIIRLGFPLAVRDANQRTPLHAAVLRGNADAAARMAARLCSEHRYGWYLGTLYDAVERRLSAPNPINWQDDRGRTALHWAAAGGRADLIEPILRCSSARVDVVDSGGRTALHLAAESADSGAVFALLKVQAEEYRDGPDAPPIDAPDFNGDGPLHLACRAGRTTNASLLLRAGASRTLLNKDRRTPCQ